MGFLGLTILFLHASCAVFSQIRLQINIKIDFGASGSATDVPFAPRLSASSNPIHSFWLCTLEGGQASNRKAKHV